ncbi:MAG: hypothetical protein JW762_11675 [Dehalococcoidales bacterium]|nr:hypothetical protein [Dehalococcoidales bacterium]
MKKVIYILLAMALLIALVPATAVLATPAGLPDGATRLYKFNIIGVDNVKNVDMTNDNGKRMFVPLNDKCKIYLQQAMQEDGVTPMLYTDPGAFDIIDANGTDGEAIFQLPAPGYDAYIVTGTEEVWSDYSIYIRSLGKPYGFTTITTCAELVDADEENGYDIYNMLPNSDKKEIKNYMREAAADGDTVYASIEQVGQAITERPKGKSDWTDVTAALTSIVFQIDLIMYEYDSEGNIIGETVIDTYLVRVPIFDPLLEGEYWEYDNYGLKLLQVWIYDVPSKISDADEDLVPLE